MKRKQGDLGPLPALEQEPWGVILATAEHGLLACVLHYPCLPCAGMLPLKPPVPHPALIWGFLRGLCLTLGPMLDILVLCVMVSDNMAGEAHRQPCLLAQGRATHHIAAQVSEQIVLKH